MFGLLAVALGNGPRGQRLIAQAKQWAEILGKRMILWVSDKQDAFVTGIAAEFPEVPHRDCDNHFLRDAAKPVLDADSHAKVQMRKKVRGLRGIERSVRNNNGVRGSKRGNASTASVLDCDRGGQRRQRPSCRGRTGRGRDLGVLRRGSGHSQRRSGWAASSARFADGGGFG